MSAPDLYYVREETAEPNDGGTFTSGAWQTRTLNTEVVTEIAGASLSSNQITLPAGTYFIKIVAPAYRTEQTQARLRNITDGVTAVNSIRHLLDNGSFFGLSNVGAELITIASSKVFELQHRCSSTQATDGFGAHFGNNSGETNVWSEVYIYKR